LLNEIKFKLLKGKSIDKLIIEKRHESVDKERHRPKDGAKSKRPSIGRAKSFRIVNKGFPQVHPFELR
jgi:hypothetical protein